MSSSIVPAGGPEFASSIEIDGQVAVSVDFLMRLRDPGLIGPLKTFNNSNQTLSGLLGLLVLCFAFSIPVWVLNALRFETFGGNTKDYFSACVGMLIFLIMDIYVLRVYFQLNAVIGRNGRLPDDSKTHLQAVQFVTFAVINAMGCIRLLIKSAAGECSDNSWVENWDCNAMAASDSIPLEYAVMVMLIPIVYSTTVRGAHFRSTMLIWCMTLGSLIVSLLLARATEAIFVVVVYVPFSLFILVESRRQNYCMFFTHHMLQETLREREKAVDAANALEMRHMIANVAHDLKTPLASFMSGIEVIAHIVEEMKRKDASPMACTAAPAAGAGSGYVADCMLTITQCISNMRNTNSFMLMTINRCIDYTKASKGVKLVPKYETIDLLDTLSLPMNCMKDVQNRISIVLEPLPRLICSHIITDKQWLQENVLCLLSNAIKYSHDGTVTISVKKVCGQQDGVEMATKPVQRKLSSLRGLLQSIHEDQPLERYGIIPRDDGSHLQELSHLRIEVEDHGIGLSEEMMATLFTPFKQAQRLAGGTGLGLFSLAKRVEALEGLCGVHQRGDGAEGSVFWFQIPYRPDNESSLCKVNTSVRSIGQVSFSHLDISPPQCMHGQAVSKPSPTLSTPKMSEDGTYTSDPLDILVVDDVPTIVKMTSMMLKRHKHTVSTAVNGAEAVKMVTDRIQSTGIGFDIILMDLQMPVMDGLEATRRLRALESSGWASRKSSPTAASVKTALLTVTDVNPSGFTSPRNVIIGVSANSDTETANEAYRMGVDAFIPKPFSLDTFYRTIEELRELQGVSLLRMGSTVSRV